MDLAYLLNINEVDIILILVAIILGLLVLGYAWPRFH